MERLAIENLDADTLYETPQGCTHFLSLQGECLVWRVVQKRDYTPKPGKRGEVQGFSDASRFRMLKMVSGIDWQEAGRCHFITLTYPDHYYGIDKQWLKLHRELFWQYFERHVGHEVSGIWRTEWKPRKTGKWIGHIMPHHHIICFREKYVWKWDVRDLWESAIGWREYVDVNVKRMRNQKQVGYYVAKYAAKSDCLLGIASYRSKFPPGRAWGRFRIDRFPSANIQEIQLSEDRALEAYRGNCRHGKPAIDIWGNRGFTVLGPQAVDIFLKLFRIEVAGGQCLW